LAAEDMDNSKWLNAEKIGIVEVLYLPRGRAPDDDDVYMAIHVWIAVLW